MNRKTLRQRNRINKTRTLVHFIQDRSGSMSATWTENLQGFKAFVDDLRKDKKSEYRLSLTVFDTAVDTPISPRLIGDVNPAILAEFGPRGMTALYDAVGATLELNRKYADDADKVIVIIVTDGQENSSREWTKERLHTAIDALIREGKTTFQYLGTQPETWDDASSIGITAAATYRHAGSTYSLVSSAVRGFSTSTDSQSLNLIGHYTSDTQRNASGVELGKKRGKR